MSPAAELHFHPVIALSNTRPATHGLPQLKQTRQQVPQTLATAMPTQTVRLEWLLGQATITLEHSL